MNVRDYAKVIESLEKKSSAQVRIRACSSRPKCAFGVCGIDSPGAEAVGRGMRRALGPEAHR